MQGPKAFTNFTVSEMQTCRKHFLHILDMQTSQTATSPRNLRISSSKLRFGFVTRAVNQTAGFQGFMTAIQLEVGLRSFFVPGKQRVKRGNASHLYWNLAIMSSGGPPVSEYEKMSFEAQTF